MSEILLSIEELNVSFSTPAGTSKGLDGVSLSLRRGEKLAVVGESGSGKTTTAMAALGLLPQNATIESGTIRLDGTELAGTAEQTLRQVRGTVISAVFQNARAALNPVRAIGRQIEDVIRAHRKTSRRLAKARTLDLLGAVKFNDPARALIAYPHELSGGMCQRAMIAMAIACEPKLLIADEPTTGLDVTTQKAVMDLLDEIVRARGMSLLLITHDLALAARYCDRITVMRHGKIVETAPVETIFAAPQEDYTRRLIEATPRLHISNMRQRGSEPLLVVRDLHKSFAGRAAVKGVSFSVATNESVGLVGESGSGKSTIARIVSRLIDPTSGSIEFSGEDIGSVPSREFHRHPARRAIQLVFQDPTDSLVPHLSAFSAIADPLQRLGGLKAVALRRRVEELADMVELPRQLLQRLPHQLSGGQKARVGIARAIAVNPRLLVLDEPTASLDVSIQAVILDLLAELRKELSMSYLFISHDLNVISSICDRTIVLKDGQIVEAGESVQIFARPSHPYTRQLLDAAPQPPATFAEDTAPRRRHD